MMNYLKQLMEVVSKRSSLAKIGRFEIGSMVKADKKGNESFIIIFTDLDDTLLDHDSYDWEKAKPSLAYCQKTGIPVILVSSKTRVEIAELHMTMGLNTPFVSENGGGIFFPLDFFEGNAGKDFMQIGDVWKLELGIPYRNLVKELKEIGRELGVILRGFSDMTPKEVSELTGLSEERSLLALSREFDEPFIIAGKDDIDSAALERVAAKKGLRISRGGRFFHLHGNNDKGEAISRLLSFYREKHGPVFALALGDSPNDFDMFRRVDQPILVRSEKTFPGIESEFPGIIITDKPGPEGWNSAVLGLLNS
jgi:mannosyl-3-phosphoglycerate phosphatase